MTADAIERLIELADSDEAERAQQAIELFHALVQGDAALREELRARMAGWSLQLVRSRTIADQKRAVAWLCLVGKPYPEEVIGAVVQSIDARLSASRQDVYELAVDMILRLDHPPHLWHHFQSCLDGDTLCRRSDTIASSHGYQYLRVFYALLLRQPPDQLARIRHLDFMTMLGGHSHHRCMPPAEVCRALPALESLSMNARSVYDIPEHLAELRQLRSLRLERCHLSALPASLATLPHLEALDLSLGTFTALPQGTCDLRSLKRLVLSGSARLASLPEALGDLPALRLLDLTGCRALTQLPASLARNPDLEIRGRGCPATKKPARTARKLRSSSTAPAGTAS